MAEQKTITIPVDIERINQLSNLTAQLAAILTTTYGVGGEAFRLMSPNVQDNVLWACAEMAERCESMVDELGRQPSQVEVPHV